MHLCCLRIECNLCIKLINEKWNGRSLIGTYRNIPTYIQCARLVYFITFQSIIFLEKKTGWVSVFWNWLRFAFILISLWMRNTQKYPFSVLFNSIFFLYKTWMSVRISKLIEVCFQKFNLIFFCKSEVQKNPFNEFCIT